MTYSNSNDKSLDKFSHSLGQNWYHIVLVPKKRYSVFQWPQIKLAAEEAFEFVCEKHKIKIFTKEIMDNHVHLFVDCPPEFSIRKLLQVLKGSTSHYIRNKHPTIVKTILSQAHWTIRTYFVESSSDVAANSISLIEQGFEKTGEFNAEYDITGKTSNLISGAVNSIKEFT